MSNTTQTDAAISVVKSMAIDIGLQEKRHRQQAQALVSEKAQHESKVRRRHQRFSEIVAQSETGFHNVMEALLDTRLQQLLDSLTQVGKKFDLYSIVSKGDAVTISMSPKGLFLRINSRRISCVQNYRGPIRRSDCVWGRWCGFTSHAPSIKFTFQNLLLHDFDDEWWDWLHPDKPTTFNVLLDEVFAREHLYPENFAFKRFFRFDSLTLEAQIRAAYEEGERLEAEGYAVDETLYALNLNPGYVLVRFFFDCADPRKLKQHLARAIAAL